jgi:anthranilate synthase component 1
VNAAVRTGARHAVRTLDRFPDLPDLHARYPARYPFLLESVSPGPQSRFDILFAWPAASLVAAHGDARIAGGDRGTPTDPAAFLATLDRNWRVQRHDRHDEADVPPEIPFRSGWFLFLSYEFCATVEPTVRTSIASGFPLAVATRIGGAIVRDRERQCTHLVAELPDATHRIGQMADDVLESSLAPRDGEVRVAGIAEDDPLEFLRGVDRIREYIGAGDVFQVNLSRAWHATLSDNCNPDVVYARLRAANPAPFAGIARLPGGHTIVSSSPERLVAVRDRAITTRPIAGTWRRGSEARDARERAEPLLHHPKERAEHVMLVDLERNDLGRVSLPGSVRVNEFMVLESYPNIHHIVSNVSGRLRPDATPADVIRAVFPGGTITGCPKVRTMQIIAELENAPRKAYTGSMGYLDLCGDMDLSILIRTLVQRGNEIEFRAGAGIVADSVPERELDETRAKARGLLSALGARD